MSASLGQLCTNLGHFGPNLVTENVKIHCFSLVFLMFLLCRPSRHIGTNFGPTWGQLGSNLGALGPTWSQAGANLGCLGPHFADLGAKLAPTWAVLGPSWRQLGPSWDDFEANFHHLEAILGPLRPPQGQHGANFDPTSYNLGPLGPTETILMPF